MAKSKSKTNEGRVHIWMPIDIDRWKCACGAHRRLVRATLTNEYKSADRGASWTVEPQKCAAAGPHKMGAQRVEPRGREVSRT